MDTTPAAYWSSMWAERDPGQVSWYQPSATRSLELITACTPDREAPIVDVGGGASPLAGDLLAHGYLDIEVLDIAAPALAAAQQRLGPTARDIRWTVADVTRHDLGRDVALWHDRAVLHFLTEPADRAAYVARLTAAVRPGGHAVIATFGPDGPTSCSGLPVHRFDRDELTDLLATAFAPISFSDETHVTPVGRRQDFLYGLFRRHG
jgi:trans-aconitate methyltransferase